VCSTIEPDQWSAPSVEVRSRRGWRRDLSGPGPRSPHAARHWRSVADLELAVRSENTMEERLSGGSWMLPEPRRGRQAAGGYHAMADAEQGVLTLSLVAGGVPPAGTMANG